MSFLVYQFLTDMKRKHHFWEAGGSAAICFACAKSSTSMKTTKWIPLPPILGDLFLPSCSCCHIVIRLCIPVRMLSNIQWRPDPFCWQNPVSQEGPCKMLGFFVLLNTCYFNPVVQMDVTVHTQLSSPCVFFFFYHLSFSWQCCIFHLLCFYWCIFLRQIYRQLLESQLCCQILLPACLADENFLQTPLVFVNRLDVSRVTVKAMKKPCIKCDTSPVILIRLVQPYISAIQRNSCCEQNLNQTSPWKKGS